MSLSHKLKFSNPFILKQYAYSVSRNISNLDYLILQNSWFKIYKVYDFEFQRNMGQNIKVCDKEKYLFLIPSDLPSSSSSSSSFLLSPHSLNHGAYIFIMELIYLPWSLYIYHKLIYLSRSLHIYIYHGAYIFIMELIYSSWSLYIYILELIYLS